MAGRHLVRTPLIEDAFRAILPAGHRLARRRRALELGDLEGEAWIGGAPTSAWLRITRDACARAGFRPDVGFTSDDYVAVQALVAARLGVSVLPGLAVGQPLPGIAVRTLASGAPVRRISAARLRDAYGGPAVAAMVSLRAAVAP